MVSINFSIYNVLKHPSVQWEPEKVVVSGVRFRQAGSSPGLVVSCGSCLGSAAVAYLESHLKGVSCIDMAVALGTGAELGCTHVVCLLLALGSCPSWLRGCSQTRGAVCHLRASPEEGI